MASEVADLFVVLRAETAPFLAGMRTAGEEGEAFGGRMAGPLGVLSKIGVAAGAVGIGVAAASIKLAGDFQASMQKLVSTAGESQSALKMVSDGVLQLARDTGTGTKELADGMYMVESAGYHGAEGLTVLKAAAEGARAEQAPLAEVSNAVTSALKSYHLGADQATTMTNQMIAAVGHGKMTFGEFAGSLSTVLPIASAAHLQFDQVGGAIATLTNHGTSAREATQELANTIRNLQAPNNVAIQEMQRLGLSSIDIQQHLGERGLTGTIDLLQRAIMQHMGPAGTVLLDVFNRSKQAADDANRMIAAMPKSLQGLAQEFQQGKISMGDWRKALKELPVDQANLASQFATLINKSEGFNQQLKNGGPAEQSFNDAMKRMLGGATGLNTALMLGGENMVDFRNNVAAVGEAAKHSGQDVEGWGEIQQTFNFKLDQLKQTVITLAIRLGTALMPYAERFIAWLKTGVDWLTQHKAAVQVAAAVIGTTLVAALLALAGAAAAAIGPELLLAGAIMAIVGAVVYAYKHFQGFHDAVDALGRYLSTAFAAAWRMAGQAVDWFRASVLPHVIAGIQHLFAWFQAHQAEFASAWRTLVQTVAAIAAWFKSSVLDWLVARLGDLWAWMHAHKAEFSAAFHSAFESVRDSAVWFKQHVVDWVITQVAELIAWWRGNSQQIHEVWSSVWNRVADQARFVWDIISTGLQVMSGAWRFGWGLIRDTARTAWDLIRDEVTMAIHAVHNVVSFVLNLLTGRWGEAWQSLKNLASQGLHDAMNLVSNLAGNFGTLLVNAGKNLINGLLNGIKSAVGGVKNYLSDLTDSIKSWKGPPDKDATLLTGAGKVIIDGLMVGFDSRIPALKGQLQGITSDIASTFGNVDAQVSVTGRGAGRALTPVAGTQALSMAGAGGSSPVYVVNVTVQGSVLAEDDLRQTLERQMYQIGMRNSMTWQPYARR
ncbi:phage tail tape measure protein [Streptomyces kaniharaensis]|uniref:Phage tail tape measure protein n=1 Tax=Streptomyces kaniharaensis TaxID=212423 RepID=A0A6N7KSD9_9ACTN|nr:phage tail tape measure protein [Streptomyces kaniharaensis]MQS14526.1 phage tail tape measure protein [Streptomyces kaniharaensis]